MPLVAIDFWIHFEPAPYRTVRNPLTANVEPSDAILVQVVVPDELVVAIAFIIVDDDVAALPPIVSGPAEVGGSEEYSADAGSGLEVTAPDGNSSAVPAACEPVFEAVSAVVPGAIIAAMVLVCPCSETMEAISPVDAVVAASDVAGSPFAPPHAEMTAVAIRHSPRFTCRERVRGLLMSIDPLKADAKLQVPADRADNLAVRVASRPTESA